MNSNSSVQKINWRQAIAEMTLIIAGVLIALAVDSRWDERLERRAEISYLESLRQDFEANQASLLPQIQARLDLIAVGDDIL